jgi:hypothetical protein
MRARTLDYFDVVRRIETAMRDLPEKDVWKIDNLKDAFIPAMAERYGDFIMPEEASPPRSETRDQLSEIATS